MSLRKELVPEVPVEVRPVRQSRAALDEPEEVIPEVPAVANVGVSVEIPPIVVTPPVDETVLGASPDVPVPVVVPNVGGSIHSLNEIDTNVFDIAGPASTPIPRRVQEEVVPLAQVLIPDLGTRWLECGRWDAYT